MPCPPVMASGDESIMHTQNEDYIAVAPLGLPKGGGTMRGMGGALGAAGPTGTAGYSLPLPISAGRGYTPALALQYSSGAGNGTFGLGWQLPLLRIARRTNRGVPNYNEHDEFIGPDGDVLVPERDAQGAIITQTCTHFDGAALDKTYQVCRYFPRVEGGFDRIERWWTNGDVHSTFWLIHGADGQLHCLGKTDSARTACADASGNPRVAEWWLEESVSPTGEHIAYCYRAENVQGVTDSRPVGALHHLVEICYGNIAQAAGLYLWRYSSLAQAEQNEGVSWLFRLVFDYGERSLDSAAAPDCAVKGGEWLARTAPFSGYEYGYETRCHRLCRQVLMYHQNFTELASGAPILVSRLLLDYDDNPVLSRLQGAQLWAYQGDGTAISQPPLMLQYAEFEAAPMVNGWAPWEGLPGLDDGQPFQMVDLYGEGLAGLLYQAGNGWHYREPMRAGAPVAGSASSDPVGYGPWQALPQLPSLQSRHVRLMDHDGDGRLDWVITQPGLAGCFTLNPNKTWSGFTPFRALPREFFHPQAQLADLIGAGLSDLALIGPSSVRLYTNQRDGFGIGQDVAQDVDTRLPMAGRDASTLVAFSDILGSGQQHLVEIRHDGVWCWPNLGRGHFGQRLHLPLASEDASIGFDEQTRFDPKRVFLADIDGSGASDLIYARGDALDLYFNQSGNGFASKVILPLPAGVRFDRLCQLNLADLDGKGVASLILTVPYPTVRHWRYDFCQEKPYLLTGINDNMGGSTRLHYRSSAQFWLDDKQQDSRQVSRLPFAVQTLAMVESRDEISDSLLSQHCRYSYGVYDGVEREFRGFTLVETTDTSLNAKENDETIAYTPPVLTRTWYHSGCEEDELNLPGQPWDKDAHSHALQGSRLTSWDGSQDVEWTAHSAERWWLFRALKGYVLRQEVYGLDGSSLQQQPYSVSSYRYQVRLHQSNGDGVAPVVLPGGLEQLSYHYERIIGDPQCQQLVELARNQYGQSTWSVAISYPRRTLSSETRDEYSNALPAGMLPTSTLDSTVDDQQGQLRLQEQRQSYYQLDGRQPDSPWLLGIPWQQRSNVLTPASVPIEGLSFEALMADDGLLASQQARCLAGQQEMFYHESPPSKLPVQASHSVVAELDNTALSAYDDVLSDLPARLAVAGYYEAETILEFDDEPAGKLWVASKGFTTYYDQQQFYLPKEQQSTLLTGATTYNYNRYGLPTTSTDAMGNTVTVESFDWRFLTPIKLKDINDNYSEVELDAFGRVLAGWFYGSEADHIKVGFTDPTSADRQPTTVTALINAAAPISVASRNAYDPFSWMGTISSADIVEALDSAGVAALLAQRFILPETSGLHYITAWGHAWGASNAELPGYTSAANSTLRTLIKAAPLLPPHAAAIQADRYPDSSYYLDSLPQQIHASVSYSDGLGRTLQAAVRDESGEAYQRTPDGELAVDNAGDLIEATAAQRWAVSGRVEYDNKGQAVRVYQPFFVDDWQYVADRSLRTNGYADTHFYDPLGRESRVLTALGYQRRTTYSPWFVVAEDENDLSA